MVAIDFRHVTKRFGTDAQALTDLNLEIIGGELLAVVGPSGSGKSTLLRLVAGLESPTHGDVRFDGNDVASYPPAERGVAMVFQNESLIPHLNVRDNLAFSLRMRRTRPAEIERQVVSLAEVLDITRLLPRWPHEISGGERQRVALGRALASDASIVLLDEPLSNVDPARRYPLREVIRNFHQRRACTVIYVTHDQDEAMAIGQRIVVLDGGQLQQVDDPLTLYQQPRNRFVAGFIGSPATNFFEGTITDGQLTTMGNVHRLPTPVPDGPVVVGIRPEKLRWNAPASAQLNATIHAKELRGHDLIARAQFADTRFACRLPVDCDVSIGARICLSYDVADLQLFTADQLGQRLR